MKRTRIIESEGGHVIAELACKLAVGTGRTLPHRRVHAIGADQQVSWETRAMTYHQKPTLMRRLFDLSAIDEAISTAEEGEIHRIAKELRVDHPDLAALRIAHQRHFSGMSRE